MIVSTWNPSGYRLNNFQLKALDTSHRVFGILCEQGKTMEFSLNRREVQ